MRLRSSGGRSSSAVPAISPVSSAIGLPREVPGMPAGRGHGRRWSAPAAPAPYAAGRPPDRAVLETRRRQPITCARPGKPRPVRACPKRPNNASAPRDGRDRRRPRRSRPPDRALRPFGAAAYVRGEGGRARSTEGAPTRHWPIGTGSASRQVGQCHERHGPPARPASSSRTPTARSGRSSPAPRPRTYP
jgi:hypothetical protein